jgi:uncharacterized protein
MFILVSSTITTTHSLFEYSSVKTITVYAPAVSSSGGGVLSKTTLAVAYPGSGRVFFSALPYTEVETQGAARIAAYVAALIANVDFSKYDYFILVESNTPLIGGPSAGGLITVGLTALLLNTSIYSNVTMTGMINPDGSIGFVGGLKEKLEAAKNGGFTVFLIPAGQRVYRYPVYEEIRRGPFVFRTVRYESMDLVEYGKNLGVSVVEVVDVGEAFYYFTGVNLSRSKTTIGLGENHIEELNSATMNLIEETASLLADSTNLARQLASISYRNLYLVSISNLNNTLKQLISYTESTPVYVAYSSIKAYQSALQIYLSLKLLLRLNTLSDITSYVNESIVKAYNELQGNKCSLANSMTQALLYSAWLYYAYSLNASDTSTALNYATEALKYVELSKLIEKLSIEDTMLNCTSPKFTEVYSHSLAVYTYVSRLIEESGQDTSQLGELNNYISAIQYMYENNNVGVYATAAFIIGQSAMVIQELAGSLNNVLNRGEQIISLYWLNNGDPLVSFYISLLKDSLKLGDTDTAALSLFTAIGLLQILRVTGVESINNTYATTGINQSTGSREVVPSTASSSTTTSVQTTPLTTTTENSLNTVETVDLLILLLLAIILIAIVAKVFASTKS